jgi:hypothetical protein
MAKVSQDNESFRTPAPIPPEPKTPFLWGMILGPLIMGSIVIFVVGGIAYSCYSDIKRNEEDKHWCCPNPGTYIRDYAVYEKICTEYQGNQCVRMEVKAKSEQTCDLWVRKPRISENDITCQTKE